MSRVHGESVCVETSRAKAQPCRNERGMVVDSHIISPFTIVATTWEVIYGRGAATDRHAECPVFAFSRRTF